MSATAKSSATKPTANTFGDADKVQRLKKAAVIKKEDSSSDDSIKDARQASNPVK
jgi:hypothetical protein